jgi:hypothetical protein
MPHSPRVVLLCIAILLHASTLLTAAKPTPAEASQGAPTQAEPSQFTGSPTSSATSAGQTHEPDASTIDQGRAQSSALGSQPARAVHVKTVAPTGRIVPAPGAKGVFPKGPAFNISSLPLFPVTKKRSSALDMILPKANKSSSAAKPAQCANNPSLGLYGTGTALTSVCRAYLYANSERTLYTMCTAWFVDSTHAALSGHCVANGGSGQFSPVDTNGRFGTVCCLTQPDTGPDNCQSGYGFDIVSISTTEGWIYSNQASNDGAVLKLTRPGNAPDDIGVPLAYTQPDPFCPGVAVVWAGYPSRPSQDSPREGCDRDWQERFAFASTSGPTSCVTGLSSPSLTFQGSSCPGMSGGPLTSADSLAWGILSQSSQECVGRVSYVLFAAISNGGTDWGVDVSALIGNIP